MSSPRLLLHEIADLVRDNRHWMTWNLILAYVPAVLATFLLWRPHRRTLGWWIGIGAFVLFLPNAPYVITDLIHLREDAAYATGDSVLVFGVLPLYAAFVTAGFASYLYCLELIVREVRTIRADLSRPLIEIPVHLVCALGIVLGRIARLNSWDTVQDPRWTFEQTFTTLTWRGAPFAFVAIFVAIWLTSAVLGLIVRALVATTGSIVAKVRPSRAA